MPGSIRKRPELGSDAWELRVFLGRDSRGRVRHKSRTFRGSKRAAQKELSRLVLAQDFEPETPAEPEILIWNKTTTVNDAIEGWKENGWDDLSPVTARRYENVWKVHIEKSIGRERIATLTPYEVERYFRKLKAAGTGRETVRYVRSVLNRACRLARKWSSNELPNPIAGRSSRRGASTSTRAGACPFGRGGAAAVGEGGGARRAVCSLPTCDRGDRRTPGGGVRAAVVRRRLEERHPHYR